MSPKASLIVLKFASISPTMSALGCCGCCTPKVCGLSVGGGGAGAAFCAGAVGWAAGTCASFLGRPRPFLTACSGCPLKKQCTTGRERRIKRWEHEAVLEAAQARLDRNPDLMTVRRSTAEHPFGTLKFWMGSAHFLMKRLHNVKTEMSLHVLSYNMKRVMKILGVPGLLQVMQA